VLNSRQTYRMFLETKLWPGLPDLEAAARPVSRMAAVKDGS